MQAKRDIYKHLAEELKKRDNPTDLKAVIIGKVEALTPLSVSTDDGAFVFVEGDKLEVSEWFRFRCDIDKTTALSAGVPADLSSATAIAETHSYTGASCVMPNAVQYLADAITKINTELLQLKCELAIGDYVSIGSLEQSGKFIILDKVL